MKFRALSKRHSDSVKNIMSDSWTQKKNIELKSSQLFNLHLHGAISHEVHSNYVGSEISVRSHYLYRWNDRGQQY